MRKLTFAMSASLDGYITAPGDDLSWGTPSDELFRFWSDRVAATGLALYGRRLWDAMSAHWPGGRGLLGEKLGGPNRAGFDAAAGAVDFLLASGGR